jgi:hypothetical protein
MKSVSVPKDVGSKSAIKRNNEFITKNQRIDSREHRRNQYIVGRTVGSISSGTTPLHNYVYR